MIIICKPGLFTTIQDLGRYGYQKFGVVTSGAMDTLSHRIANLLVGNEEDSATLEVTLIGPVIQFQEDTLIAICGANLSPTIDGEPIPMFKPLIIKRKQRLRFGACLHGVRAYIAFGGGLNVPLVLKSSSTYVKGKMGGFQGRTVNVNDEIPIGPLSLSSKKILNKLLLEGIPKWKVKTNLNNHVIRVTKGLQFHLFTKESQKRLYEYPFQITKNADRMGYRLSGPPLNLQSKKEMISEAVDFGTVQIMNDGMPVILLADRQTIGGYPKIAQVISIDLPKLAQMKPGDMIQFEEVSLKDAQNLLISQEKGLGILKKTLHMKFT